MDFKPHKKVIGEGIKSGSTASTTVYDGKEHLITATLADTSAFIAIYDEQGNPLAISRLNSITHNPDEEKEHDRILSAGGTMKNIKGVMRVDGVLAVSRAIGDRAFKEAGVCSEASIDITNFSKLLNQLGIAQKMVGSFQVITACDGFTDAAGTKQQHKQGHEKFLLNVLQSLQFPGRLKESDLAQKLIDKAKNNSRDNISVAIKSIPLNSGSSGFIMGVYDGHGGSEASSFIAKNIGINFKEQCRLQRKAYAQQALSVDNNFSTYKRDNPNSGKVNMYETSPHFFNNKGSLSSASNNEIHKRVAIF